MVEDAVELREGHTLLRKAIPKVSRQCIDRLVHQCEVSRCTREDLLFRRDAVAIQLDDAIDELVMIHVVKEVVETSHLAADEQLKGRSAVQHRLVEVERDGSNTVQSLVLQR